MTFRVGIIGGGNISDTHARAAAEIDGVRPVAFLGRDAERTGSLAATHGGRAFTDLDAFLAEPMDAVIVGSPSGMHAEQARAAAERGLHVLVEKPLDVTTARIDALIETCDRRGVTLGVIFQDRTAPDLIWLKRLIDDGALGRLVLASASVRWYRPAEYYAGSHWRGTWALDGGGALMNQGIHTVDLLLWLLGDVSRVAAATRTALHDIEVEDTAVACLEFANGGIGTLEATTAAYPGFPRRVEITGTEGTIVVEQDRIASVRMRVEPIVPPPQRVGNASASASSPVVSDASAHRRVLQDFVNAVRSGDAPLCTGRDGRRSVALIEAIYGAARDNSSVALGAAR